MFNLKNLLIALIILSFPINSFAQCQRHINPEARVVPKTAEEIMVEEMASFLEVSYEELTNLIKEKSTFIVDANKKKTYKSGHIPGAISYVKAGKKLNKKLPKDKNALVIVYCGSSECTGWVNPAKEIKALGYTNVKHFKGGIKGWKEAGGVTE